MFTDFTPAIPHQSVFEIQDYLKFIWRNTHVTSFLYLCDNTEPQVLTEQEPTGWWDIVRIKICGVHVNSSIVDEGILVKNKSLFEFEGQFIPNGLH